MKINNKLNANLRVVKSAENFAQIAADAVVAAIKRSPNPLKLIGLSGGSTPFPVYRLLPQKLVAAGFEQSCYWLQVDERLVPASDERSNQRSIRASLFADQGLPEQHFFAAPVVDTADNSQQAALAYHNALQELPEPLRSPAPADLLIMGIGTDGHTASLFPGTDWQRAFAHDFAVFSPPAQPEPRISMTLQRIMQARELLFLVTGAAKQQIVEEIFLAPESACAAAYIARQRATNWIFGEETFSTSMQRAVYQQNTQEDKK